MKVKKYYNRLIDIHLREWVVQQGRKPLLLRGARQVGKSSAVRQLATQFEFFVEANFEETAMLSAVFNGDLTPQTLIADLQAIFKIPIIPGKTLLFFDEVQVCPQAIASLRFFYEKMPDLHLIAAGSLLEFALQELPSFGVGRIRSIFMYPFAFDEFLMACGEDFLLKARSEAGFDKPLNEALHQRLVKLLREFLVVGGMPEAVAAYVESKNIMEVERILDDIYLSFQTDFAKYKRLVPPSRLADVFESVIRQTGGKFIYNKVSATATHLQVKEALNLLILSGLAIPVTHTAANGLPLGAESDAKKQKIIPFDTGIFQRILGLSITDILLSDAFEVVNKGAIAEVFVGLELLKYTSPFTPLPLYYWHREAAGSNAETDYVVHKKGQIYPVEVKAARKGSMQSLRQFLKEKQLATGIRISLEPFARYEDIEVVPLYAVANWVR